MPIRRAILAWTVALLAGCATFSSTPPPRGPSAGAPGKDLEAMSEADRDRVLSEGYSQLYDAASGLRWLDEFLLVKFESDDTQRVITDLAHYASQLKGELEQLEHDYPSLSIHNDGLPLLEKNKREMQAKDRAKTLAPLIGAKGADFERTLLLTQSGALNQLRFLAQAIVDAEKSGPRRTWMIDVQRRLDHLYVEVVKLLDRRFFRAPAHSPTGAAGAPSH